MNVKKPTHFHSQSVSFALDDYESKEESISTSIPPKIKPQLNISNYSLNALDENGNKLKHRNKRNNNKLNVKKRTKMGHFNSFDNVNISQYGNRGYLFYFNERPIKDNDYPNGYINLCSVQCVIGLLEDDNNNNDDDDDSKQNDKHKVKYLKKKNKGKESEYYEIILKTKDREWIFGCLDSKSYVEWLMRLKKFEQK